MQWTTAQQITSLVTSHLAPRLGPSLPVWSGGQLSPRASSGRALWCSIYCCRCCSSLSRCFQQSNSLGFGTTTSDTLAHREGRQGVGQSVWGLHNGGRVGRSATRGEGGWGGRNRDEERTREGNWKNGIWKGEEKTGRNTSLLFFLQSTCNILFK